MSLLLDGNDAMPDDQDPAVPGSVRFLPAGVELPVRPGESIVEAMRRQGYRMRYSCRRGGCAACKADLVEGQVGYPRPIAESVLSAAERAAGKCLPCQAVPDGDVVVRLGENDRLRRVFGPLPPPAPPASPAAPPPPAP